MIFWIVAALLAAAVLAVLLAAGLRERGTSAQRGSHDLAVYHDQLAELERDRARGVIGAEEATAAEAEIKRRMMAAADTDSPVADTAGRPKGIWPFAVAFMVPCVAIALYMALGRPDLAIDGREQARGPSAEDVRRAAAMSPQDRARMIRGMVEGLAARLKKNPNDVAGWMRLGRAWTVLKEWAKAAGAYQQAMRLRPKDPAVLEGFIAARLRTVPPRTPLPPGLRAAVGQLAMVRPNHPLALYFGGVIAAEGKKYRVALGLWRVLLARLPEKSPLAPVLKQRIAAVEKAMAGTGNK